MLDNATMSVLDEIKKSNILNSLVETVGTPNYFASIVDTGQNCIATATDGVGSKIEHLIKHKMYDVIGKDCFAMCYNDLICVGANPLGFSDHITSTPQDTHIIPKVISGIADHCKDYFTLITGGETEILKETKFHISGTMMGTVQKDTIIDGTNVEDGDLIVGINSSGIHANGWTLIAERMPQLIEPNNLTATRVYNEVMHIRSLTNDVSAIVNITGGGFRNLERIPKNLQYNIQHQPSRRLFEALGTEFTQLECYTNFNMGVGLIIIVKPKALDIVLEVFDGESQVLGMVQESDRPSVIVNTMQLGDAVPYKQEIKEAHELEFSLTDN